MEYIASPSVSEKTQREPVLWPAFASRYVLGAIRTVLSSVVNFLRYSPLTDDGRKILSSALMKRAIQDVRRIMKVREEKAPLAALVKSGCVGEDLLANIEAAEEELNTECEEVDASPLI